MSIANDKETIAFAMGDHGDVRLGAEARETAEQAIIQPEASSASGLDMVESQKEDLTSPDGQECISRIKDDYVDADEITMISMRVDGVNRSVVEENKEAIQRKDVLPGIRVFKDSVTGKIYCGDGAHRVAAYVGMGFGVPVEIYECSGAERLALHDALGANAEHGRQRSNADKHRAVMTALQDGMWGKWTPKSIATMACPLSATRCDDREVGSSRDNAEGGVVRNRCCGDVPATKNRPCLRFIRPQVFQPTTDR